MRRLGRVFVGLAWLLACAGLGLQAALAQDSAQPLAAGSAPQAATGTRAPALVHVVLKTARGDIVLALETERAPLTSANFLRYVDQKRLDGGEFYRAVALGDEGKYGLIQGGLHGNLKRQFKPIAHESTSLTGLSHDDGAISMARRDPGTATAEFFIIIGGLSSLDAQPNGGDPGYAVFGHVIQGMDVVREIMGEPTSPTEGEGVMKGQMLAMPVKIQTARRAD
jgi:peptidyl-prolyl cis-trans isomerase A (cyclophilin A)